VGAHSEPLLVETARDTPPTMKLGILSATRATIIALAIGSCGPQPANPASSAGASVDPAGGAPTNAAAPAAPSGGAKASAPVSGAGSGAPAAVGGRGASAGATAAAGAGATGGTTAGSSMSLGGAGAPAVATGPRPQVAAAAGTTLVKVDPSTRYQTFEGWGTSLCWWANHVGGWDEAGRNAVVDAVVDPVAGLGYNIFRYNIGGGENPAHDHMGPHKDLPGFQPSSGTWDWNADANQRAVLQRIMERGSGVILEAFSNSPPYWMTKSGCASGSSDGGNNLKDDSYDAFADYLSEVVKHFRDSWGITFRTLEPLNEPNANWWKSNGGQEGCHFSPSNQQQIIKAVGAQLSAKGLSATSVSASDENSMDEALANLRTFDEMTLSALSQLNVHSYAGSRRAELHTLSTNLRKRLWQSESGPLGQTLDDDTDAALFMAGRIIADLRDLKPEAWLDWQVADPGRNWASLWLEDAQQTFTPLKRFYMHAGFSRYIRPGATFIHVDHPDMVAALSGDGQSLTLVARNPDRAAGQGVTFDLSALPSVGATSEALRTSRTEDLQALPAIPVKDWSFVAMLPASSITTFVLTLP
jgi:O-glycosyl hydrolase